MTLSNNTSFDQINNGGGEIEMGSVYPPGDLEEGYPSSVFKMTPTGLLFCVVLCLIIFISISGEFF